MKLKLYHLVYRVQYLTAVIFLCGGLNPSQLLAQTELNIDGSYHRVDATGDYQDFIIPTNLSGTYEIKLRLLGADGGSAETPGYGCKAKGGDGAYVTATFNIGTGNNQLRPGGKLRFIPGKGGHSYQGDISGYGTGGGGTAILYTHANSPATDLASRYMSNADSKWVILAIAGGGGGAFRLEFAFCGVAAKGQGGRSSTNGGDGNGLYGGDGGSNGSGGASATFVNGVGGQGGAGAFGSGGYDEDNTYLTPYPDVTGSHAFIDSDASFGFGGGGTCEGAGGGGGGYSGGGGGGTYEEGGGGGSFVNEQAIESTKTNGGASNFTIDDGYIEYQVLQVGAPVAVCHNFLNIAIDYDDTDLSITPADIDNGSYDLGDGTISLSIDQSDCQTLSMGSNLITLTVTDDDGNVSTCQSHVYFLFETSGTTNFDPSNRTPATVNYSGTYQDYFIPSSGTNQVICFVMNGGDGGYARMSANACGTCKSRGGYGAWVDVCFTVGCGDDKLSPGGIVRMIVGGKGSNQTGTEVICTGAASGGGGGGTGLLYKEAGCQDWEVLAVAGGGGGAYQGMVVGACVDSSSGRDGATNANGNGTDGKGDSNIGEGGTNGNGGEKGGVTSPNSSGGGGYLTDGVGVRCGFTDYGGGKAGGNTGGNGGSSSESDCSGRSGGFGFGGGGLALDAGAGGGGYSGGGPGGTTGGGGGGGSYVNTAYTDNYTISTESYSDDPENGYIEFNFINSNSYSSSLNLQCKTDHTITLDDTGIATLYGPELDNGSSSDCGDGLLFFVSFDGFKTYDCSDIGTTTIHMLVAEVSSGANNSCQINLTVQEEEAPEAVCQNLTVALNTSGTASLDGSQLDGGSTDNCGIASFSSSVNSFSCDDIGENQVTLSVTDGSGNTSACLSYVSIVETSSSAPTAQCKDATVNLNEDGNASITVLDIDNNSTDNCSIVDYQLNQTSFTCNDLGQQTVTLTVEDNNEATGSCTAAVTVMDSEAPSITCNDMTVQLNHNGLAENDALENLTSASDNCSITSELVLAIPDLNCNNIGDHLYFYKATDPGENSSSCTGTITVADNISPTAHCQDLTLQLDENGAGTVFTSEIDNGSFDNCQIDHMSLDLGTPPAQGNSTTISFDCNDLGQNTVTLGVTDAALNTTSCTATVTVEDNVAPLALCQNLTIALNAEGMTSTNTAAVDNGSNDACGIASLALSQTQFDCTHVGANTVTVTVTDNNENSNTCTATINVQDDVAPVAQCQNLTVQLNDSGETSITAADIDNGSSDACGIASLALSQTDFDCTDVGANLVTLTVIDANGNSNSCSATVTVQDNVDPIAICQNVTVQLDANGNGSTTENVVDNGSNDACGIASLALSQTDFDCSHIGANSVTLTVTDANGNSNSCSATVTVQDNVAPTAICQNVTVQLDATGNGSTTENVVDNGSNDACGIASLALSQTDFDCTDVGANLVTLTVIDANGNSNSCSATVTVQDNVAPTAICQNVTVQLDATGNGSTTENVVDNGSNDACGVASLALSQTDFDCTDVGANLVTLTVTDTNGNSNSCSATVTVQDNVAPTAICQNVTVQLDATGNGSTTENVVDNGSNDACGISSLALSQTNFDCSHIGANSVTLTVTDTNGNSNSCSATVTVQDNVAPTAICQNVTVQLDANGNGSTTENVVDNGSNDACGIASLALSQTDFDCTDVGANLVTLTVTDTNGNSNSCSATVTVQDNVDPIAICQNVTVQLDANGNGSTTENVVDNGSNDACGIASLALSQTNFDCSHIGANSVTLTVTDTNGNSNSCSATVTVQDNMAPAISECEGNFATFNGQEEISSASVIDFIATDACGIQTTTFSPAVITCDQLGQNVDVLVTVIDVNGNSNECLAVVKTDGLPCGFVDFGEDGIDCEDSSNVDYDTSTETFTLESDGCVSTNFSQDNAAYTYTELCGNGEIIAHVTNISPLGQGWAGITMRESEAHGARKVEVMVNLGNFLRRSIRWTDNGYAYPAQLFRPQAYWLKIVRNGNLFLGYASTDGINWQNVLMASVFMNNCIQAGLVVTNYSGNTVITGTFDNVEVNSTGSGMNLQIPETEQAQMDQSVELDFNLSPNPASDRLFLEIIGQQGQKAEVEVLNQLGQRVLLRTIEEADSKSEQLDLHMLKSGTYFLLVRTNQAEMVKKFLIVR